MERLKDIEFLSINQQVEHFEVFTKLETCNKYRIIGPTGEDMFFAQELMSNFFLMNVLKSRRPFTLELLTPDSMLFLRVVRPFRFIFQDATVYDGNGRKLGSIRGELNLLNRLFTVLDSRGREVYHIRGPRFKPWTFFIESGPDQVGTIKKRWSGLVKEAFTDADNFGIEFPVHAPPEIRAILLGAVFLIDFAYFESTGGN